MYRDTVRAVLEAITSRQSGTLVIKTLTTDDADIIQRICAGMEQAHLRILTPFHPLQNCHYLFGADLVIAAPTTLLAEAAAMRLPVFTLDYHHHENWYPVSAHHLALLEKIAPVLADLDAVSQKAREVCDGTLVRHIPDPNAMTELFGAADGQAMLRIWEELQAIGVVNTPWKA